MLIHAFIPHSWSYPSLFFWPTGMLLLLAVWGGVSAQARRSVNSGKRWGGRWRGLKPAAPWENVVWSMWLRWSTLPGSQPDQRVGFMHLLLPPCCPLCLATVPQWRAMLPLGWGQETWDLVTEPSLDDFPVVPAPSHLARSSLLPAGPPSFAYVSLLIF